MATTNSLEPDPTDPVISISTTEISTSSAPLAANDSVSPLPSSSAEGAEAAPAAGEGSVDTEGPEAEVWESRYAFGNFAGRFIFGGILVAGCAYLAYLEYGTGRLWVRPLTILLGITTIGFWAWLCFRIIRARLSHHYRLTTRRLFVSVGIFQRRQDIMELEHLKEVTLQQRKLLDHIFKIGTVMVASNVSGTPVLYLLGVKEPQKVSDLIYNHARN